MKGRGSLIRILLSDLMPIATSPPLAGEGAVPKGPRGGVPEYHEHQWRESLERFTLSPAGGANPSRTYPAAIVRIQGCNPEKDRGEGYRTLNPLTAHRSSIGKTFIYYHGMYHLWFHP